MTEIIEYKNRELEVDYSLEGRYEPGNYFRAPEYPEITINNIYLDGELYNDVIDRYASFLDFKLDGKPWKKRNPWIEITLLIAEKN